MFSRIFSGILRRAFGDTRQLTYSVGQEWPRSQGVLLLSQSSFDTSFSTRFLPIIHCFLNANTLHQDPVNFSPEPTPSTLTGHFLQLLSELASPPRIPRRF